MTSDLPPQDIPAEMSILGSALVDSDATNDAVANLSPSDFYHAKHNAIFTAMQKLHDANEPVDTVTVANELKKVAKLKHVGGRAYLAELSQTVLGSGSIKYWCKIVRDKARYRLMASLSQGLHQDAFAEKDDVEELAGAYSTKLSNIVIDVSSNDGLHQLNVDGEIEMIEKFQSGEAEQPSIKLPCGLDRSVSIPYGEVSIIAARPRVGKTSLGLQVTTTALVEGKRVAFFSLEMTRQSLVYRMLSQESQVPEWRMKLPGKLDMSAWSNIRKCGEVFNQYPLKICDQMISVRTMRLWLQQAYKSMSPDLVVVDYLQQIRTPHRESRNVEVGEISSGLKQIAKEFNCAVLALSQFNRQTENRESGEPKLSDLRDSGSLEQDAAVVVAIHRKTTEDGQLDVYGRLLVLKNRYGRQASVPVKFHGETFTFSEIGGATDNAFDGFTGENDDEVE